MLTIVDENGLLASLYAGVVRDAPWTMFLTQLRVRTGADASRLFVQNGNAAQWREVDGPPERPGDDVRQSGIAPFESLRPGRVYSNEELGRSTQGYARHLNVRLAGGDGLALSIERARSDFRAADAALLAHLAPHLGIAFTAILALARERRRNAIGAGLRASFAMAWLLLDERGRIVDVDDAAMRLIEAGKLLRRSADGRVRPLDNDAEAILDAAMAMPGARAARRNNPVVEMLICAPPLAAAQDRSAHRLLLIRAGSCGAEPDHAVLADLYGLGRSEAALAACIARGLSLIDAAHVLGLSVETVRNYSKRIFAKTGARGQADLVRILLGSVAVIQAGDGVDTIHAR